MRKVFILLFLVFSFPVFAQDPLFRILDKSAGLPSNTVYDIMQDDKGFMWFAHDEGVSKYDGFQFSSYSSPTQTSKPGSSLQKDKYGRVWYSNFDGYLYYVENESMHALQMGKPLGFTSFGIGENYIYTVEQEGIIFYDLLTLKRVDYYRRNNTSFVASTMVKDCFIFMDSTIHIFKGKKLVRFIPTNEIPDYKFGLTFFTSKDNSVIFSPREKKDDFLLSFDLNNGFSKIPFQKKGFFQNFSKTGDLIWACTPQGVTGFTREGKVFWGKVKPLFAKYNISGVYRDRFRNYWFTTLSDGIIIVPDLGAKLISPNVFKPLCLGETKDNILIGNRGGEIYSLNSKNQLKRLTSSDNHDIIRLYYDSLTNKIYFANRFFQITNPDGKPVFQSKTALKDICSLNEDYLAYAATGKIGLLKMGNATKKNYWDSLYYSALNFTDNECSFLESSVRGKSVAYNPYSQSLYYATNIGLYKIQNFKKNIITMKGKPIFAQKVRMAGKRLFCLTGQNILYEILPNDSLVNRSGNLSYKNIKYSNGYLFLIGNSCLHALSQSDDYTTIYQFENPAGDYEINDIVLKGKTIYAATNAGLIVSPLLTQKKETRKPPFYIQSVFIGGQSVGSKTKEAFPTNKNEVIVNYAILNYLPLARTPLYYRLNNDDWKMCSQQSRTLKLPYLSPGKYAIQFKFENEQPETDVVEFEISKPYYVKWWFIATIVLILFAFFMFYHQLRLKRLNETSRLLLEKMELEKSLGVSTLTAIKSQMNPHFFYNALNTIQSYIISNDGNKASTYLNKFSKLTRLILEMSEKETVPISDELRSLRLYLELEQGRFDDDDFDFSLEIDAELEDDWIQIPSMLVQPYVENAIKHGLLHKKGKKNLKIVFKRVEEELQIEVTDNGIGREHANKINAARKEYYQPFSTNANQKRLEILNKGKERKIWVETEDHRDANGNATGTSVYIGIPITLN